MATWAQVRRIVRALPETDEAAPDGTAGAG
jgi:hypothetical protein